MSHTVSLLGLAVATAVALRHARARWATTSSTDTLVQLWRRAWPSARLSWGQIERRVLGRMLAGVTAGVSGRVLVPARFTVRLSATDHATIGDALPSVVTGLTREVMGRAHEKGWELTADPIFVEVVCDPDVFDGAPSVDTSFTRSSPGETMPATTDTPTVPDDPRQPPVDRPTEPLVLSEVVLTDGTVIALPPTADRVTVGRRGDVDVHLPDQVVSGWHLAFFREGSTWRVADLGSTNGTFLNGARVMPGEVAAPVLRHGDEVRLGTRGPCGRVIRHAPDTTVRAVS